MIDGRLEATASRRRIASEDLSRALRKRIDGLPAGEQLPTERALVTETGASRSAIRRALAVLQEEGRITRHVGRGTFVAGSASLSSGYGSPSDIMDARLAFEPSIVRLALTAATSADIDDIARCVTGGARSRTHSQFEDWDLAFHRSIALATHNPLVIAVYSLIDQARRDTVWGSLKRRSFSMAAQELYCQDHARILAGLRDRDPDSAPAAMRQHLLHARDNLLQLKA